MASEYPPVLRPGDTIGVVAPAGVVHRKSIETGIRFLRDLGYQVRTGQHLFRRDGFLAGNDRLRAADMNMMIRDSGVHAILCARGGYGSIRIIPHLDLEGLVASPKILVGYSDITVLLLHVYRNINLVTYHGPMVSNLGPECPPHTVECLFSVLGSTGDIDLAGMIPGNQRMGIYRDGTCTGELAGGCLSLLQTMSGTDLAVDWTGKIMFWEEVGEKEYRLDRMLNHLSRAGYFDHLSGMIIGRLTGCFTQSKSDEKRFRRMLDRYFGQYSYPVLYNAPIGHTRLQLTLPVGGKCTIDTGVPSIVLSRY